MRVTPEYVRGIRFGRAPIGHRGYDPAEVDAFCAALADAFAGRAALSAAAIRGHEFGLAAPGRRDYDRDEVDAFLDRACVELEFARYGPARPQVAWPPSPEYVSRLRFSAPPLGRSGYVAAEVDAFRERVAAVLAQTATGWDVAAIRPEFGTAAAGVRAYHCGEVDAFVDAVAALVS